MSFRAIQPAPPGPPAPGASTAPPDKPHRTPKNQNACASCRKSKTRCNGTRPKCGTCVAKNVPCIYIGEEGQSRVTATKSRLESLEKILTALRTGPPEQADHLLQHIRSADNLAEIVDASAAVKAAEHESMLQSSGDNQDTVMESPEDNREAMIAEILSFPTAVSSTHVLPHLSTPSVGWPGGSRVADTGDTPSPTRGDASLDARHSRPQNESSLTNQSCNTIQVSLPDASVTAQAIDSFFACSGKLFHVYSRDQILQCYHDLYTLCMASANVKAEICAVMAVASVGAQYMPDSFSKEVETGFYDLTKHFFDVIVEQQPLKAIKTCTLLAQYNILDKAMVSLAYVEIGLSLSRMHGLDRRSNMPQSMSISEWLDLQKPWRTLVFFSSWLSSTLGYISGNDVMSERIILSEIRAEDSSDISEVVQTEMVKICILKADILRMQLAFKELTLPAMQSVLKDLQNWYRELPDRMRIEANGHDELGVETKRSILHVQLLYLGAIMLLYRRVAAQYVQWYTPGACGKTLPRPFEGLVVEQSVEAVLAANTSARLLKGLLEDGGIFKRCWLVIFQAYTTGTVLLHAAAQKQLHDFEPSEWKEEKERAEDCISVLAFCGSLDRVAATLHEQLVAIHEKVFSQASSVLESSGSPATGAEGGTCRPNDTSAVVDHDPLAPRPVNPGYLLDIPAHANATRANLSLSLLVMLSLPFGDRPKIEITQGNAKIPWLGDPTRHEFPQLAERTNWTIENNASFYWDLNKLNLPFLHLNSRAEGPDGSMLISDLSSTRHPQNRFVGSAEPSGWAPAVEMTTDPDR